MPRTTRRSARRKSVKTAQDKPISKTSKAAPLAKALIDLDKDWVLWEPETLWAEVRRATGAAPSEILKGKIQGIKTLLTTDAFWRDHLAFEKVVVALNNRVPTFDQYQHPSPAMIALAIAEAATIREGKYSDEVLRYIATVCFNDGFVVLPKPLDIAQESLDELTRPIVGRQMREDLGRRLAELGENDVPEDMYTETVTGVQLARAQAVREYVRSA